MIGIANHRTGALNPRKERIRTISVTVPDRTLTMRDLINRHLHGGVASTLQPIYTDSKLLPDNFEMMSLVERAQFAKDLPHLIADSRGKLQTLRHARELELKKLAAEKEEKIRAEARLQVMKEKESIEVSPKEV